jgi:hypothetical protein
MQNWFELPVPAYVEAGAVVDKGVVAVVIVAPPCKTAHSDFSATGMTTNTAS